MTLTDQGIDLLLENVGADGLETAERLTEFAEGHGLARLSIDEGYGAQTRWEPEPVTVSFGGVSVPFPPFAFRSEEHTSELQSLMRISYAVFCLKKKHKQNKQTTTHNTRAAHTIQIVK